MKAIVLLSTLAFLSACSNSAVGNGSDADGSPVTAKYTQKFVGGNTWNFDVTVVSGRGLTCKGNDNLEAQQGLYSFQLNCQDGVTGTATLTADYINARDTIIYRLSNGESGRTTFGASTLQTSQY
jgi:hypothetical protein